MSGNPIVDQLKAFLTEHPELVGSVMSAAAEVLQGPPTPLTIAHVLHDLVDGYAQRAPVDAERVAQMHAVIDEHYAQPEAPAAAAAAPSSPEPSSAPSADPGSFDPPGA